MHRISLKMQALAAVIITIVAAVIYFHEEKYLPAVARGGPFTVQYCPGLPYEGAHLKLWPVGSKVPPCPKIKDQ